MLRSDWIAFSIIKSANQKNHATHNSALEVLKGVGGCARKITNSTKKVLCIRMLRRAFYCPDIGAQHPSVDCASTTIKSLHQVRSEIESHESHG